jgi:hypothetical protein
VEHSLDKLSPTLVKEIKPAVWVPRERPDRRLKDVLFEVRGDYVVFWYHWPKDGYAITNIHEDYEPVILVVKNNRAVEIGVRPHNAYRHSNEWLEHRGRPIIIFRTAWHESVIYNGQPSAAFFANSRFSTFLETYPITQGIPPPWFTKADSNISVYDYSEALAAGTIAKLGTDRA